MSKLLKLREWSSVGDAAKRLSDKWSERVSESDVLRLALNGQLTLSVNFVIPAMGLRGKRVPVDQTQQAPASPQKLPITDEVALEVESGKAVNITGVWDLPMEGAERLDVERRYHRLTGGPDLQVTVIGPNPQADVADGDAPHRPGAIFGMDPDRSGSGFHHPYGYGVFVNNENGTWCRLQRPKISDSGNSGVAILEYVPASELPDGADFVVRTAVVEELASRMLTPPDGTRPAPPATEPAELHPVQPESASETKRAPKPPGVLASLKVAGDQRGDGQARGGEFSWENVTIRFTIEHRVQITTGGAVREPQSYTELGFADKRVGRPNRAWAMLQELAQLGGRLQLESVGSGKQLLTGRRKGQNREMTPKGIEAVRTSQTHDRQVVQKQMQELRRLLRDHFNTAADPVPFKKGSGYETAFRIEPEATFD